MLINSAVFTFLLPEPYYDLMKKGTPVFLSFNPTWPDGAHPELKAVERGGSFSMVLREKVPLGTVLMVSPIVASIGTINPNDPHSLQNQNNTKPVDQGSQGFQGSHDSQGSQSTQNAAYHQSSASVDAMAWMLLENGMLDHNRPNFSLRFFELITFLHPRSETYRQDFANRVIPTRAALFAKLHRNAIGGKTCDLQLMQYGNLINSSCVPNVQMESYGNGTAMLFKAIRPIEAGEQITISYSTLWPVDSDQKRSAVSAEYGYNCTCDCCTKGISPSAAIASYPFSSIPFTSHCWFCGSRSSIICGKCIVTTYCSDRCQADNWKTHSTICQTLCDGRLAHKAQHVSGSGTPSTPSTPSTPAPTGLVTRTSIFSFLPQQ